jgi:dihydroflavonol-4-reductase
VEVLVTGATGFVGRYLVEALQARGHRVRALVLPIEDASWLRDHQVAIYPGDLCQPATLPPALRGVDGVFHLAAMTRVWRPMREYYEVNVVGTEHLCRAALREGVQRFVHVSSAVVYGLGVGRPVDETSPFAPIDEPYSMTKAQGDRAVQAMIADPDTRLPAVIIRPGTAFGPGDSLNFGRIADRLRAGTGLIIGSGRNALTLVYVTDLVQGLLLALTEDTAVGEAFNIGNDQPMTQAQALRAIAEAVGARPPRRHVPYRPLYALAAAAERVATLSGYRVQPPLTRQGVKLYGTDNRLVIDKARRVLGYTPQVSLGDGIRCAAAWYRQRVPLGGRG